MSKVLRIPAAGQAEAVAHFAARLALETDVSDVAADLGEGVTGLVVADSRSQESWDQGHVAGAIHLPRAHMHFEVPEIKCSKHQLRLSRPAVYRQIQPHLIVQPQVPYVVRAASKVIAMSALLNRHHRMRSVRRRLPPRGPVPR